ncbi:hypothetical protein DGG96_05640 [Legionella qingyii]|uniref:Polysaccharide chain length determinant N-terminal domain-containing protein n=1 Tax=Legionella qingyii TaxID=2184757 RepID=A0A317U5S7_9GAMM|nr:Wzz/FepE/Etk N-terminal domain-containing protein [Legionella qingyii]PWY56605.1 hypothetical protein DGG96_05640 [Legionella qingyii]RUR23418.1 hypothetical protein ELY20_07370 [Legionella qingyii]RUR26135.1 hypothetical protein ELY16_08305 [Legionella qingyii]
MKQQINHASSYEEIDSLGLLHSLWQQKWLIIISVLTASAYIAFTKPAYEVQAWILPADTPNIDTFNYEREVRFSHLPKPFGIDTTYNIFPHDLFAESTKYNLARTFIPLLQSKYDFYKNDIENLDKFQLFYPDGVIKPSDLSKKLWF